MRAIYFMRYCQKLDETPREVKKVRIPISEHTQNDEVFMIKMSWAIKNVRSKTAKKMFASKAFGETKNPIFLTLLRNSIRSLANPTVQTRTARRSCQIFR